MSERVKAIYRARGCKDKVLHVARRDGDKVDLANEEGRVIVRGAFWFDDEAEANRDGHALPFVAEAKPADVALLDAGPKRGKRGLKSVAAVADADGPGAEGATPAAE